MGLSWVEDVVGGVARLWGGGQCFAKASLGVYLGEGVFVKPGFNVEVELVEK